MAASTSLFVGRGERKDYILDSYAIGSGGFAEVFAAKHRATGHRVAFKRVKSGVRNATERFAREIEVMRELSHPNVMPLLDADKNHQWYVMPLADGSLWDLARVLDELSLEACFIEVAEGLKHAHAANFVHRDVTPNNILRIRDPEGIRWVVADWGLVRRPPGQTGELLTQHGVGTEGFAAPEVWSDGHEVDLRADIYSLGRVVAWALTRMLPKPNIHLPAPGKWKALVERMTATDRRNRHDRLELVVEELRRLTATGFFRPLVAIGPHIVCEGDLVEVSGADWTLDLDRFLVGDEADLLTFSDVFDEVAAHDKCVTLEARGESRTVLSPPHCTRNGTGWRIRVAVGPRVPRPSVDGIGTDLCIETLESIGGRARLPQIFRIALSTERGEMVWAPDFGGFLRQRFSELGDTPLFERIVSLEAMRLASIPYVQSNGDSSIPLRCVDRIVSIKLSAGSSSAYRSARVVAEVSGMGRWEGDVEILVAPETPGKNETPSIGAVLWSGRVGGRQYSVVLAGRDALWNLRILGSNREDVGQIQWDPDADSVAYQTEGLEGDLVRTILNAVRKLVAMAARRS